MAKQKKMLTDLARVHHIPMITSVLARSVLKFDDPLNFGCIGGAYGHRYANMIANAKVISCFVLGFRSAPPDRNEGP